MALVPTLTINDTTTFSDAINFSVTDSLTVTAPSQSLTKVSVATGSATQIFADSGSDGTVYVYLKNTDSTNFIVFKNDAGNPIGRINAEEFAFFGVDTNEGLEVQAAGSACVVEYAYWTKS